jgi:hypothetical protein
MKEVFEVHARWPDDHPLAGEVKTIGRPLPSARRATLLLMSGTICNITVCDSCPPTPENLSLLWTICMQANAQELEDERRDAIGSSPVEGFIRESYINTVQQMVVDLPIAVLTVQRWEKVDDFAARTRSDA